MSWIVGILSVFLVIACLLLILLVLIQLPKKEAGMGQAFGGSATDALFGAGSGTALTKMTKYTTVIFLVLTLFLWVLKAQEVKHRWSSLEKTMQELGKTEKPLAPAAKTGPAPTANPMVTAPSNSLLLAAPTNAATKNSTNATPAAEAEKAK